MSEQTQPDNTLVPEFLSGGGEMGQRIREFDWSATAIGPIKTWPQSLRTCVKIMLDSRQPIWIGWGKELIKLYNDPYRAIAGGKHPYALGLPATTVWKDIIRDIAPMIERVMGKGEGIYTESQLLIMERNGYPEETYYTFSYTPMPGDDGVTAGMICFNTDDTDRIVSDRQLRTLTLLGKSLTDCRSNREIGEVVIRTLADNPHDFPFGAFYEVVGEKALLSGTTNWGNATGRMPVEIDWQQQGILPELFKAAVISHEYQMLEEVRVVLGEMPRGVWEAPPVKAMVLPLVQSGVKEVHGFLVVGLNPYRLPDEKYMGFFTLIGDQIAAGFANVHVLEEERKRVEALAEIDRAKTIFFSNISHEFRTPLTLLLGPLEEALSDVTLPEENRFRLEVALRNALRMQKLVNTLLEFSRIEAGRMEGRFSKVDIVAFTEDLASLFRSAIEKAGMSLVIRGGKVREEVYVDRDMWEKIILNLVSNAFKYSKEGSITIAIQEEGPYVQVAVSDTGIGIARDQLEDIFNRFHRIEHTEGRSQEGTGIGLAMVKELVKLHNGVIAVESLEGAGSTFTVFIPTGKAHLPEDRLVEDEEVALSANVTAFVEEAKKWLPAGTIQDAGVMAAVQKEQVYRPVILLADDNADMRDYVCRLLSPQFQVVAAEDGEAAFQLVLDIHPDLVLTDIMMPKLDGLGLLKKLRSHTVSSQIPVVLLSARAGEEAKMEGLDAGADDYLVKPFSAKELMGRVNNLVRANQVRQEADRHFRELIMQAPVSITVLRGPALIVEVANDSYLELVGKKRALFVGKPLWEGLPEVRTQGFDELMQNVLHTGESFTGLEYEVILNRKGKEETIYVNFIYSPLRDLQGRVTGIMVVATEVTSQVLARKKMEEHSALLEQEVRRRTQELSILNDSLQQSNADLQQFAHVTSHDLKEPVRKIKTFSGRIQDEYGDVLPERGQLFLQKVMNATDRIYSMIEGVLTYSTLNANRQAMEPVSIDEVITNIEADLEVAIQQKNAIIQKSSLPVVKGIPTLLYQLFYNLLNNSLKFARADIPPVIIISANLVQQQGRAFAEINVADNGIGFEAAYADKIFDTFARLNPKDEYEGTGLGLALCKKITERHGGVITAYGSKGKGACFVIMLPLDKGTINTNN